MQKQKIFKVLFILFIAIFMLAQFTYATDIDTTALSNSYNNSTTNNTTNTNTTTNSISNSINNSVDSTKNSTTNTIKPVTTTTPSVSSTSSLPEADLGFTNILNIVLIVIGLLLILLGIAILIRLKK